MHFGTLWYCDLCYQWEDVLSSQTDFLLQGYEYVQFMLTVACINHTSIDKDLTSNQPLVCLANVNINIETLMNIIPDSPIFWDAQNAASICCPLLTIPIPIYISTYIYIYISIYTAYVNHPSVPGWTSILIVSDGARSGSCRNSIGWWMDNDGYVFFATSGGR